MIGIDSQSQLAINVDREVLEFENLKPVCEQGIVLSGFQAQLQEDDRLFDCCRRKTTRLLKDTRRKLRESDPAAPDVVKLAQNLGIYFAARGRVHQRILGFQICVDDDDTLCPLRPSHAHTRRISYRY